MRRSPHKAALEAVRKLIHALGGTCNVMHQGHRGPLAGSAGVPDLYIQLWRQRFWVEIKAGRDKLSPAQQAFKEREEVVDHGTVIVGGVDEVMEYLGLDSQE